MESIPLDFIEQLPSSAAIQAATQSIKEKIRLGQEKYEQSLGVPETLTPPWVDENDLKSKISAVQAENQKAENEDDFQFNVRLRETETIHIFEMGSAGYLEGTEEGEQVSRANEMRKQHYASKIGILTSNQSCQTEVPLLLRKCLQTTTQHNKDIGCTVTEWDMMDSFKKLERMNKKQVESSKEVETSAEERFLMASQVLQRLLSSNNFNYEQLIYSSPPRDIGRIFKYTFLILWKSNEAGTGTVNHITTNPANRNLVAVAYGDRGKRGTICVWNSKNPQTPEKKIIFQHAVTCSRFSNESPYFLTAVTESGDVLIVDVRTCNPQVTVISRSAR